MKRDDIIKLADQVGGLIVNEHAKWVILQSDEIDFDLLPILERFATLVAAAEREACAKVCDADGLLWGQRYAAAIRERGKA